MTRKGFMFGGSIVYILFFLIIIAMITSLFYTNFFSRVDEDVSGKADTSFTLFESSGIENTCTNFFTYCCIDKKDDNSVCEDKSSFSTYIGNRISKDCKKAKEFTTCIEERKKEIDYEGDLCGFVESECP